MCVKTYEEIVQLLGNALATAIDDVKMSIGCVAKTGEYLFPRDTLVEILGLQMDVWPPGIELIE